MLQCSNFLGIGVVEFKWEFCSVRSFIWERETKSSCYDYIYICDLYYLICRPSATWQSSPTTWAFWENSPPLLRSCCFSTLKMGTLCFFIFHFISLLSLLCNFCPLSQWYQSNWANNHRSQVTLVVVLFGGAEWAQWFMLRVAFNVTREFYVLFN